MIALVDVVLKGVESNIKPGDRVVCEVAIMGVDVVRF